MKRKLLNCSAITKELGIGDDRSRIITSGRILMAENAKRALNAEKPGIYTLELSDDKYSEMARNHKTGLFKFASKAANTYLMKQTDTNSPVTYEMAYNDTFIKVCQDIMSDIITPMLPIVTNDMLGLFAQTYSIAPGRTKSIAIKSNAIFNYEDTAYGVHSAVNQYLYKDTVTLNPHPVAARAKIHWFEYFANDGDIGELYNAMALGWYAYITGRFAQTFDKAISSAEYTPSPLVANTYSTKNYITVIENVRRANGGGQIASFGDRKALSGIGPESDTEDAYRFMLGQEWAHIGYLKSYKGSDLYAIDNALIPETINTTLEPVFSESTVWVTSLNGGKPIHIGMGTERMTIELTPDKTVDDSMVIESRLSADVAIAMGSRIGAVLNVG